MVSGLHFNTIWCFHKSRFVGRENPQEISHLIPGYRAPRDSRTNAWQKNPGSLADLGDTITRLDRGSCRHALRARRRVSSRTVRSRSALRC